MALLMGGAMALVMLSFMVSMIPHHSIAILTSERAAIDDVRVRELADGIIKAPRLEMQEMEWLLNGIEQNGLAATEEEAAERPIPDFEASAAPAADVPQAERGQWLAGALESHLSTPPRAAQHNTARQR